MAVFTQFAEKWDGAYYIGIARTGYGPVNVPDPRLGLRAGLAGVVRVLRELGNDEVLLFVVNQLVLLIALAGVYRIARRYGSERASLLAVWSLALFPASFVFSMSYPSSMFLAASVWAFLFVDDGHDVTAGILAAGAALLRPNGLIIAISLAVAVRSARRIAVVATPAVLALGAWCWYCYAQTGDPLVFITTKEKWQEITAFGVVSGAGKWSAVPHLLLALAAIVVVVWQRRRLPVAFLVLTALSLLPSLVTGMVGLARTPTSASRRSSRRAWCSSGGSPVGRSPPSAHRRSVSSRSPSSSRATSWCPDAPGQAVTSTGVPRGSCLASIVIVSLSMRTQPEVTSLPNTDASLLP